MEYRKEGYLFSIVSDRHSHDILRNQGKEKRILLEVSMEPNIAERKERKGFKGFL
jgi:hypothetical protein